MDHQPNEPRDHHVSRMDATEDTAATRRARVDGWATWQRANADAIDWYNSFVEANGIVLETEPNG